VERERDQGEGGTRGESCAERHVGGVGPHTAGAVERALDVAYPLRDEEWGVRRFMLREPSGTIVNVLSHRSD
jgi:hypothetical protein